MPFPTRPAGRLALCIAALALAGCAATGAGDMNDAAGASARAAAPGKPQWMLVGIDEKVVYRDGKPEFAAPGRDQVAIVDIGTDPLAPRIVASLPLSNSIFGPPTNLAITPDGTLALVADPMKWVPDGAGWKPAPGDQLHVIDLSATPPRAVDTVTVGSQPSGLSINRAGTLALVANRAGNSVSVLRIAGGKVTPVDTVQIGEPVAHVAFTPDGTRALAAKFNTHKVALLQVDGEKVTYAKQDLPAGLWPYNLDVTPDGRLALTADNGNAGAADGHADTVSVIDLAASPPRVIDKVVVGDAPEGLAISPTGRLAVAVLLDGTNAPKTAWFHHPRARVVALRIDGDRVTRTNEVMVGALPEGVVFSDDGRYVYVGNYMDRDVSILRVDGDRLVDTGRTFKLPGQPASMRGRTR